jgi:PAS domain S-box-containing protein
MPTSIEILQARIDDLRLRLTDAEGVLAAIRASEAEPLRAEGPRDPPPLEGSIQFASVIVENLEEGVATLTESGTILFCNGRFAQLLGAPLERVIGSSLNDWMPDDARAELTRILKQATESAVRDEVALRSAVGERIPIRASIAMLRDDRRRSLCLIATDLREQKRYEQALADGLQARAILDQAAAAIVVCDEKGQVTRANALAERLCGRSPDRAHFDAAFPMVPSSSLIENSLVAGALQGAIVQAEPAWLMRGDGSPAALLASAVPLRDPTGRITGCVVAMIDVSERRRGDEALHVRRSATVSDARSIAGSRFRGPRVRNGPAQGDLLRDRRPVSGS